MSGCTQVVTAKLINIATNGEDPQTDISNTRRMFVHNYAYCGIV